MRFNSYHLAESGCHGAARGQTPHPCSSNCFTLRPIWYVNNLEPVEAWTFRPTALESGQIWNSWLATGVRSAIGMKSSLAGFGVPCLLHNGLSFGHA